jgi:hypothetical protein
VTETKKNFYQRGQNFSSCVMSCVGESFVILEVLGGIEISKIMPSLQKFCVDVWCDEEGGKVSLRLCLLRPG